MPQEITTTVYTINELSEEARDKAINHFRDYNTIDDFWFEDMTEVRSPYAQPYYQGFFQEQAEGSGFDMRAFYFSGFWSQGDGACFEAFVDYEDYILKNKLGNRYRMLLSHVRRDGGGLLIKTRGHYSHANTMYVEEADRYYNAADDTQRAYDASEKADAQAQELIDEILEHAQDLADDFYRQLEREYEYLSSDEQIIESLDANEMLFNEDGTDF
jgi:hypothetical protein